MLHVWQIRLLSPVSLGVRKACGLLAQESLGKMPWGKLAFPGVFFSDFLGPEAHKLSVPPAKLAKIVFSAKLAISPEGVQGPWPLVQVHEGRRGPRSVVSFVIILPFIKRLVRF